MKLALSILFLLLASHPANSQNLKNWKNYTDMKNVASVSGNNDGVWAASGGGGFFYNAVKDSFQIFTKTDGLNGSSLSAVTVDASGKVWFGSNDGIIDVYDPTTGMFKTILDIYNSDKSSKKINNLTASGDTILVSTDFGVSLIGSNDYVFYDTYFKFGNFPSNSKVNSTFKSDLIFVSTSVGLAIQKKNATNLSAPESWNVYTASNGLPSNNINQVVEYNDTLIAATSSGLSYFDGNQWNNYLPQFSSNNINDIITGGKDLYFIVSNSSGNNYKLISYANGKVEQRFESSNAVSKITYSPALGLLGSTSSGVIQIITNDSSKYLYPNGPEANQFPSMSVDADGNLWCASGRDVSGVGFYDFKNDSWQNVNKGNTPSLSSNYLHVVYSASAQTTYFGSWGNGFVKVKNDSVQNFTKDITGITGIPDDPNFLVISGFGMDSKNNLWVLSYGSIDRNILAMLTPDNVWYHFSVPATGSQALVQYFNLAVDQYDTKWFNSLDPNRSGLYYFNENGTYKTTTDDKSGYITTSSGLNSNTINAVAVDRRGDVWVGTNLGVNIISNTSSLLEGTPQFRISSVYSLRQQNVNCIAVDPLNQKWIGTNQGLLLVNSDGSSLLAALNSSNSPLLSDEIRSIAIDENTGTVYAGTDKGLTSFQTSAIKPQETFTDLKIYPSPFILKNNGQQLTIDGLIRDSDIKILTISGKLVKEFSSPGGRIAFWDGTDSNGDLVNSGVYLVVAFDQDGNNVKTGKIAVLHQ